MDHGKSDQSIQSGRSLALEFVLVGLGIYRPEPNAAGNPSRFGRMETEIKMNEITIVKIVVGTLVATVLSVFAVSSALGRDAELRKEKLYQECLQTNVTMLEMSIKAGGDPKWSPTISCHWR